MKIKSAQSLVAEALKEIKTIDTDQAFKMVEENSCNLIDIRDVRELEKEGRIENSHHIPRGMMEFWLDPNSPYFNYVIEQYPINWRATSRYNGGPTDPLNDATSKVSDAFLLQQMSAFVEAAKIGCTSGTFIEQWIAMADPKGQHHM